MGLHRLRGFLGIVAALALTAGALAAAVVGDHRDADFTASDGF